MIEFSSGLPMQHHCGGSRLLQSHSVGGPPRPSAHSFLHVTRYVIQNTAASLRTGRFRLPGRLAGQKVIVDLSQDRCDLYTVDYSDDGRI